MRIARFAVMICGLALIAGCGGDGSGGATSVSNPCGTTPSPGDACDGGAIYLGALTPGAISGGSETDHYMTTPSGCTNSAVPTCGGTTDTLTKVWNGTGGTSADITGLVNYTTALGTGYGAINTDQNYGDANTAAVVADASIGTDSAAAYCDNLIYGGYSDWYLPNRYELNLFYKNQASIPGLNTSGNFYWASTEYNTGLEWDQRFSDGYQNFDYKTNANLVRCVRRY